MDPRKQSQNNGLASIAVLDSSSSMEKNNLNYRNRLISRSLYSHKTTSFGSGMFFNGRFQEQQPHFLDACFLCKKPLGCNRDIFMYRGDTPFCSEECRAEQIEMDEAKEKKRSFSASIKAMRKKEESEKSSNNNSSPNYPLRSGAVAAA